MSITASDITTRFADFASVAPATINIFIADAVLSINTSTWGDKADIATVYYTAHLLSISGLGTGSGASGSVTKKKVGDLEKQFAEPNITVYDSSLGSTVYGRRYLALRKEIVTTPLVINFNQDFNT